MAKFSAKTFAAGLLFVSLVGFGCRGARPNASGEPPILADYESIASDYIGAPGSQEMGRDHFGFTYHEGVLVISSAENMTRFPLDSSSTDGSDTLRFGHSAGPIFTARNGAYAMSEVMGSDPARAFCFSPYGDLSGFVLGDDVLTIQFSEDCTQSVSVSTGVLTVIDLGTGATISRKALRQGDYPGDWTLVPGAQGRFVIGTYTEPGSEELKTLWWDAIAQHEIIAPKLNEIPDFAKLWVDRGRVLVEDKGVADFGPLPGLPVHNARTETRGYSPWIISPSPSKKAVQAQSIFKNGKKFSFHFKELVLQSTQAFGQHALVICFDNHLEIADLRNGKIVAKVYGYKDRNGDIAVVLNNGDCAGTPNALKRRKLSPAKADGVRVRTALDDLLTLGPALPEP